MTLEARVTPIWKKQKFFLAIFLIAFGAYFYWDGAIGWPRNNERYLKHKQFQEAGNLDGWHSLAKERGWKTQPPEKLYSDEQITGQFIYGTMCVVAGLITLGYWLQQIRRVLKLDDESVTTPSGTRVPFDAITGLGLKKWESKGLATVRYELSGRKGQFVVDDYKFDTTPTRQILDEIKKRLEGRPAAKSDAA
jgi:hypothetical protein